MKLKKVKASKVNQVLRCTVHKTGKLGFTRDAADFLELDSSSSLEVLINEEDKHDNNLYVLIHKDNDDVDNFKVSKAGDYYYVNLKSFYEINDIDYKSNNVSYNIRCKNIDGKDFIVFMRRSNEVDEAEDMTEN